MISDSHMAERLRVGDEAVFSHLYEKYSATLLDHLFHMVGKREVAEELLHEVFMTVLGKINFYKEDPLLKNSFKAWIFRIATNRAIDEIESTRTSSLKNQA